MVVFFCNVMNSQKIFLFYALSGNKCFCKQFENICYLCFTIIR
ncbi:Uncharacterized protein dnm_052070 [Desulfonema magnum]|uniref:Uncharacterized protein n=1 Tax=Desulfonema magnum TaxID=45655 RepID=A0A975GQP1_9BACT|nr:Uncharacterized protein dnm_052070 [Desulfonema magnum]